MFVGLRMMGVENKVLSYYITRVWVWLSGVAHVTSNIQYC